MQLINKYVIKIAALAFSLALTLHSCKKDDLTIDVQKEVKQTQIEAAKKSVATQIEKLGGIPEIFTVNEKVLPQFSDMQGNILKELPSSNNLVSACAGDLPEYVTLTNYQRIYTCGVGYRIKFAYEVSWNNNIVLTSPFNASNRTRGNIRIVSSSGATLYNNSTFDAVITDFGDDPNLPGNNIFYVEFTSSTLVPYEVFNNPGATLRLGGILASDCASLDNYPIALAGVNGCGVVIPINSDPCTRNDKAWFQQPGIFGSNVIGISGYDPLGTCPTYAAGVAPSYQEVWYRLSNTAAWTKFSNHTSVYTIGASPTLGYPIFGSQFVTKTNFAKSLPIPAGTYNIQIRYRNVKLNAAYALGVNPEFSANNCFAANWTVETYNGIVIN
jgi:hypothetical protein